MNEYVSHLIRNVALISHGGAGKTTLTEAMLYNAKITDRIGKVEDGNTVSDFDPEEAARALSISASVIPIEWKSQKINIVDTPGYFDFVGDVLASLRAVDGVLTVVSAAGTGVGTEKCFKYCSDINLPLMFFINKLDKENTDFFKTLKELKDLFGNGVIPLQIPIGKEYDFKGYVNLMDKAAYIYKDGKAAKTQIPDEMADLVDKSREELVESIAGLDEKLIDKYFNDEELTLDEMKAALKKGIKSRDVFPVLCGSGLLNINVNDLMDSLLDYMPEPENIEKPASAFIFKTIADPYVGKLSIFKVMSGNIKQDMTLFVSDKNASEKLSQLYVLRGKKQIPIVELKCGDIGAVAKLSYASTSDTLSAETDFTAYDRIDYPEPNFALAIEPKTSGDEEKINSGLSRLNEEDPTFKIERNNETGQVLIYGYGEMHIEVITKKLISKFGTQCQLTLPKVAYRETIKGKAKVEGKHKKQTGGHGQYGHVWIEFEPSNEDFEFVDKIFGGAVPRQYIPAVEKGLRDCMKEGILAGYPVVNVKASLLDGSYHPVDSSEMAFKVAASIAFKKGMQEASPVLLEPVMSVTVFVPENFMGDVIGDLNKRRAKILGMEPKDGMQVITAEVPEAELFKYATDLRSITHARGYFTMKFLKYEEVPQQLAARVIEEAGTEKEA